MKLFLHSRFLSVTTQTSTLPVLNGPHVLFERNGRHVQQTHCRICPQTSTTGYSRFVECQKHSAKAQKHPANALPSVTLGIQHTALICRQTVVSQKKLTGWNGDVDFAECTTEKHSTKFLKFAECQDENTRQSFSTLPSVNTKTLGKVPQVCRVSGRKHSAKFVNFAECHA